MAKKILHISGCDKFIPPFVELIKENFNFEEHEFLLTGGMAEDKLIKANNVHLAKKGKLARLRHYFKVLIKMHQADKVILHGLFDIYLVIILFFTPWLLKKCYWVMWGGDLYAYKLAKHNWKRSVREFFRRSVIKKIGYLVTGTPGDADLARKWYQASGRHIVCFNYPSNTITELDVKERLDDTLRIQLGNSADPTNRHEYLIDILSSYKSENIQIFAPLSYGDRLHAGLIIEKGKEIFGNKFIPLTDFMSVDEYREFQSKIDIAVFAHKRQQAFGNTLTLLGMGKKVFIDKSSTLNGVFKSYSIKVYDIEKFDIQRIKADVSTKNIENVKKNFSKDSLIQSLSKWVE